MLVVVFKVKLIVIQIGIVQGQFVLVALEEPVQAKSVFIVVVPGNVSVGVKKCLTRK